eukprot:scaffold6243_cov180-Ochromonas_danica.AAC.8
MDVALVKYRIAATQTPNSAQLWNNVGMCFFGKVHLATGQYASAFHYLSTAINLQPTYARAYTYLAQALSKLEDFENSCAAYEKALELSEDYFTHLNYSITLFLNDEVEKSAKHFQRFEALFKKASEETSEVDNEVKLQAELMRKALFQ